MTNLIGAILRSVAQDIKFGNYYAKKDALEFLESDWYKELCDVLGLDPVRVKRMIMENKVSWRNKYE